MFTPKLKILYVCFLPEKSKKDCIIYYDSIIRISSELFDLLNRKNDFKEIYYYIYGIDERCKLGSYHQYINENIIGFTHEHYYVCENSIFNRNYKKHPIKK